MILLLNLQYPCKYMYYFIFVPFFHRFLIRLVFMQVMEFQQRKCCVIFELSSNLARVLEFCTYAIPRAFLAGTDTNLRRLTELILFILNHMTSAVDDEFFDL